MVTTAGLALDAAGNMYIVEINRSVVSRVSAATGLITTIAGVNVRRGLSGDGGPATAALLNRPQAVWVDENSTIFIADTGNGRIRAIRGPLP